MESKVFTTEGPVFPQALGYCLAHEHFFIDLTFLTQPSPDPVEAHYYDEEINLENFYWIQTHATFNRRNGLLVDEGDIVDDFQRLVPLGVETVIDCTPRGIGFNPAGVKRLARRLNLKVVHGTGYYIQGSISPLLVPASAEAVADILLQDLWEGFPETDYKAGFIGEIGTSWPMTGLEERVLHGACIAQKKADAALFIHPGYSPDAPEFVSKFVERNGVDPSRVVLCHCDSRLQGNLDPLLKLAQRGFYIAYDTFGRERYSPLTRRQHPSDAQRIEWLRQIVDRGFLHQIHLSTDVCWRTELSRNGGYGREHLYRSIVPRMRDGGFSGDELRAILVDNPARAVSRPAQ